MNFPAKNAHFLAVEEKTSPIPKIIVTKINARVGVRMHSAQVTKIQLSLTLKQATAPCGAAILWPPLFIYIFFGNEIPIREKVILKIISKP